MEERDMIKIPLVAHEAEMFRFERFVFVLVLVNIFASILLFMKFRR